MKKTYKANNISCENCANMIKATFFEEFGEINVNLSTSPKEVTLEIKQEQEQEFKVKMKELGFEIIEKK